MPRKGNSKLMKTERRRVRRYTARGSETLTQLLDVARDQGDRRTATYARRAIVQLKRVEG